MGYCHTGNCLQLGSTEGLVVQAMDAYGACGVSWSVRVYTVVFIRKVWCHHHAHTDVSAELPGFSEGADLKDVADLAATLLQEDDESRTKLMDEIVAKEMAIFESLVDGRCVLTMRQ